MGCAIMYTQETCTIKPVEVRAVLLCLVGLVFSQLISKKQLLISCGKIVTNYTCQLILNKYIAVLAPLTLLLVLEARCAHFVIAHFNYFVLCSA